MLESGMLLDIPEETIQTANGERIFHTKKIPLNDEQGRPEYLLGISEDITERKRAERENCRKPTAGWRIRSRLSARRWPRSRKPTADSCSRKSSRPSGNWSPEWPTRSITRWRLSPTTSWCLQRDFAELQDLAQAVSIGGKAASRQPCPNWPDKFARPGRAHRSGLHVG